MNMATPILIECRRSVGSVSTFRSFQSGGDIRYATIARDSSQTLIRHLKADGGQQEVGNGDTSSKFQMLSMIFSYIINHYFRKNTDGVVILLTSDQV